MGPSLCSAAIGDVSSDSFVTALELSALETWLVRPANEDCKDIDCGSHVKACSDQADGKVEKDIITFSEEKRSDTVVGGRT